MDPLKSKRLGRFVEEYVKDRNGGQAAVRAGFTSNPHSARTIASRLLAKVEVRNLVRLEVAKVSRLANVEAADILREWMALATADPSRITHVRRVNCRYCHGEGHLYQWTAREYAEAYDLAMQSEAKGGPKVPDFAGGLGYVRNAPPAPDCPECQGEGTPEVFICDTEALTGPERKLIAGVKQTRDGVEIKMRDQDGALLNIAKHLGMLLERKELSGPGGVPLQPTAILVCGPDDDDDATPADPA